MVYEARHSRGLNFALTGACLLLSILGFAAAGVIPTQSGSDPMLGWAIVVACFAAAFIFFRRASDKRLQARIDLGGLYVRRHSAETIPWDHVDGAYRRRSGIQRIVRFDMSDPIAGTSGTLGINTTFYDRGMDDLVAVVSHYRPDLGL